MCKHDIPNKLSDPLLGIGYLQLLMNEQGEVEDYLFLNINSALEVLSGWSKTDLEGKKASKVLASTPHGWEYWFAFYTNAMRLGKTQEIILWLEEFQYYLTISAVPIDKTNLVILTRKSNEEAIMSAPNEEAAEVLSAVETAFNSNQNAVSLLEYNDGKYRYVRNNAVHQRITGFENVMGQDLFELVGEDVGKVLQTHYEKSVNTGQLVNYEQEFDFASGRRVWQTEVTPIFSKGGVPYLLLFSKDISELKEIQKENQQLTSRLHAMFNQHSAMQMIFDPDSGQIVAANPAACRFYGYSREELVSMQIQDINTLPVDMEKENLQSEQTGGAFFSSLPHRTKNGDMRMLDIYSCTILNEGRKLRYSISFDVTERETLRSQLMQEKELLRTTLQSIGDGVVTTDNGGIITSLNNVGQEITGWESSAAIGRLFSDVFILKSEETGLPVENPIQQVLDTGRTVGLANHTELVNFHGQSTPIADSAAPIRTENGQSHGVVMVFRDVSIEKEHHQQIEFLSYHDPLTGLYNRRYIEQSMSRLDRAENLPIAVVMGDVNGLKLTNDVFGHQAGDILLQSVANVLQENCKEEDLVARWGGDEFVIFMPRTSLRQAEAIIQTIQNADMPVQESGLGLSLSLGCAVKETINYNIQDALKEAEEHMYHQKLLDGKSYRNAIINTLLATLYEKSNETQEHSKRLEEYCHAIGRKLGLSSKELNELSLLALLHDIGKGGIDLSILQKPGSLTQEEWAEMKRHPEIGYRIARATPELLSVADLILTHHERWDGKGYPNGLLGEEIPLACRILAVTDAFDAMTHDRIYRHALSTEEAIVEISQNSGTQFDPTIATIFIEIMTSPSKK